MELDISSPWDRPCLFCESHTITIIIVHYLHDKRYSIINTVIIVCLYVKAEKLSGKGTEYCELLLLGHVGRSCGRCVYKN
jgi:hypothetical protein